MATLKTVNGALSWLCLALANVATLSRFEQKIHLQVRARGSAQGIWREVDAGLRLAVYF